MGSCSLHLLAETSPALAGRERHFPNSLRWSRFAALTWQDSFDSIEAESSESVPKVPQPFTVTVAGIPIVVEADRSADRSLARPGPERMYLRKVDPGSP